MAKKKTAKKQAKPVSKEQEQPVQSEVVKSDQPQEPVKETKQETAKPALRKADIMKQKLEKQPKVRIIIPKEKAEPEGATETVILNGYRMNIKKGVYVEVPEQVAEIIMDSQQQTAEAYARAEQKLAGSDKMEFDNRE